MFQRIQSCVCPFFIGQLLVSSFAGGLDLCGEDLNDPDQDIDPFDEDRNIERAPTRMLNLCDLIAL